MYVVIRCLIFIALQNIARKALDVLWERRQKGSDLVGTVINIHNEEWVRRGERKHKDTRPKTRDEN